MDKYILFAVCMVMQAIATISIMGSWYFLTNTDSFEIGLTLSVFGAWLYAIIELISQMSNWNRRQELGFQLLFLVIFSEMGLWFIPIKAEHQDTLLLVNVALMLFSIVAGVIGKLAIQQTYKGEVE